MKPGKPVTIYVSDNGETARAVDALEHAVRVEVHRDDPSFVVLPVSAIHLVQVGQAVEGRQSGGRQFSFDIRSVDRETGKLVVTMREGELQPAFATELTLYEISADQRTGALGAGGGST